PQTQPSRHQTQATEPSHPVPALAVGEAQALVERQYRQAAQAGDPAAMRNLAVLLSQQGRTAEAETWNQYANAIAAQAAAYPQNTGYGPYAAPTRPPHLAPAMHPHAKARYSHAAIYSLSFGLVGLITCGLPSIPAIVAGHVAWVRMRRTGERGLGMAVTGIALGWIMVAFWALVAFGWSLPDEPSP
ncbi:DUF4190 domain-containing protein, partial [Actinomadura rubrisoli]